MSDNDHTPQPAAVPERKPTVLETLQSTRSLLHGALIIVTTFTSLIGGAAMVDEKASGAAIAGSEVGQRQAAAAVEDAIARALPAALAPMTGQLAALNNRIDTLQARLTAVEHGVVLPQDVTTTDLPRIELLPRQHRARQAVRR